MARYLFSIAIFMLTYAVTLADPPTGPTAYGQRCNTLCANSQCNQAVFTTNCVQECIKVLKIDQCPMIKFQCSDYVVSGSKSCAGHCGTYAGKCWCDSLCTLFGDCCCDFNTKCDANDVGTSEPDRTGWGQRCNELCDSPLCDNAGFNNCIPECINVLKINECPGPKLEFNCYNYPSVANGNSCEGKCNGAASSCYCDPWCVYFNDCCCDYSDKCEP